MEDYFEKERLIINKVLHQNRPEESEKHALRWDIRWVLEFFFTSLFKSIMHRNIHGSIDELAIKIEECELEERNLREILSLKEAELFSTESSTKFSSNRKAIPSHASSLRGEQHKENFFIYESSGILPVNNHSSYGKVILDEAKSTPNSSKKSRKIKSGEIIAQEKARNTSEIEYNNMVLVLSSKLSESVKEVQQKKFQLPENLTSLISDIHAELDQLHMNEIQRFLCSKEYLELRLRSLILKRESLEEQERYEQQIKYFHRKMNESKEKAEMELRSYKEEADDLYLTMKRQYKEQSKELLRKREEAVLQLLQDRKGAANSKARQTIENLTVLNEKAKLRCDASIYC